MAATVPWLRVYLTDSGDLNLDFMTGSGETGAFTISIEEAIALRDALVGVAIPSADVKEDLKDLKFTLEEIAALRDARKATLASIP